MDLKLKDNALLATPEIERLNYITASGQCNIDTGVDFDSHTASNYYANQIKIDAVIEVISNTTNNARIYDANGGGSAGNTIKLQCNGTSSTSFKAWCNNYTSETGLAVTFTGKTHIVQGFGYIEINGVRSTITPKNAGFVYRFKILSTTGLTINIHSFKIYLGDTLVRDYVPMCVNNIPCLYDSVNNVPYYSASTGTFTANYTSQANSITTAYVKDCPNISGINILRNCPNLTRVCLDLDNVSGSIEELLSYTLLSGFNNNYEPQVKPRLVGTWTINYWYTQEQLDTIQSLNAFDGLTIVADPDYLIHFDELAVQTLDSNKPNYNPAAAIILRNNSQGITLISPVVNGQEGRWFMTKTQAANLAFDNKTNGKWFQGKGNMVDTDKIVSSAGNTYTFSSFNEFQYFTQFTQIGSASDNLHNFHGSSLHYLTTPGSLLNFFNYSGFGYNKSNDILYIREKTLPTTIAISGNYAFISSSQTTNRYILSGYKDKYKDENTYEQWMSKIGVTFITQIRTYYEYCAPKITYDGTNVTMTVERTSTIYYTTDGSIPTIDSTQYTQAFAWDGQGVIKAMAIDTTNIVGDIAYAQDFYVTSVADPIFTLNTTNKTVTISCATSGATIYYTTDGTCPNYESDVYSAPITTQEDIIKVRCFAVKEGMNNSDVVGKICVLNDTLWGTDGDSSSFAVQAIDSTKPNYNQAVAVKLYNNNKKTDSCYGGGYYLSKTDAASITTLPSFESNSTITDTLGIIGIKGASYNFTSFLELKYFTSFTTLAVDNMFKNCKNLTNIYLENITNITCKAVFYGCSALTSVKFVSITRSGTSGSDLFGNFFNGCSSLVSLNLGTFSSDSITKEIGSRMFNDCSSLNSLVIPENFTNISHYIVTGCTNLSYMELPSTITSMKGLRCFATGVNGNNYYSSPVVILKATTPPAIDNTYTFANVGNMTIYVGSGVDADADNNVLSAYQSAWTSLPSRVHLDTYYNYLHPQS